LRRVSGSGVMTDKEVDQVEATPCSG
jgi:hypothetical protein